MLGVMQLHARADHLLDLCAHTRIAHAEMPDLRREPAGVWAPGRPPGSCTASRCATNFCSTPERVPSAYAPLQRQPGPEARAREQDEQQDREGSAHSHAPATRASSRACHSSTRRHEQPFNPVDRHAAKGLKPRFQALAIGGAGGNRTPVHKSYASRSTYVATVYCSRRSLPDGQGKRAANPVTIRGIHPRYVYSAS